MGYGVVQIGHNGYGVGIISILVTGHTAAVRLDMLTLIFSRDQSPEKSLSTAAIVLAKPEMHWLHDDDNDDVDDVRDDDDNIDCRILSKDGN
jgi:hypothetical protein